jgi:integrase
MNLEAQLHEGAKRHRSKNGYWFEEDDSVWQLRKGVKVYVGAVRALLDSESSRGFTATLVHYASTLSADHTANMAKGIRTILDTTASSSITVTTLINFRATLTHATEYRLGAVSGFICAWHDLGYPGIDDDVVDLLESWTLRGNDKGDAIKRLDPAQGPLTDNELMAFNESATSAFEKDQISITDLSIALLTSNTGRRPIQVTHTKICDLDGTRKNKHGDPMYVINIPRAKQQGEGFRESFTAFAMSHELWAVLNAQRKICIASVETILGYELQEADRSKLPLFPDLDAFYHVNSLAELRQLLQTDYLHLKSETITDILQKVVLKSECYSERTGEILELTARRFRYTIGTRAAREGCGKMIIAELLDHADTQNVDVYTANTPEFAAKLDEKLGFLMAPYARAFMGIVVDKEQDAKRGDDLSSRIRHNGAGAGTCGTYGYCGANAPIPCYTCTNFQPWLDGPHEKVYQDLLNDRQRVYEITKDEAVTAALDRTIYAVAQVILRCKARREELARQEGK